MHLYCIFTDSSEWTNLDEELLQFVSEERKNKINRYRFLKEKKQSLFAALLLPYACTDQYDLPFHETDPVWPSSGKPHLASHPEIHFSIAHSGSCSAVAVSDREIGLDAELIAEAPRNVMKKAFSPAETARIEASGTPDLEFYRIWTRKEAYGKYLGTGLSSQVLKTDTLLPEHDQYISEGILTPSGLVSREDFLKKENLSDGSPTDDSPPALYYSLYGKEAPAELICVSPGSLVEYYLLCI